jgi:glycosyltransferase involved in cell wall biosynthesis
MDVPRVQLVLAGRLTPSERQMLEKSGVGDGVAHLGLLRRSDALALQRSADALLVITSGNRSEATGKLFEYLGAGRPIIALAEGNEAARIVNETNSGITVPPNNVDAIAAALRRLATGDLAREHAPLRTERYAYPGPAERMAEVVERAIARRQSRDSRER